MAGNANIPFGHSNIGRPGGPTADSWTPYDCGYCGRSTSGAVIATVNASNGRPVRWLQCPNCHEPSVVDSDGKVHPGVAFGPKLEGLPPDVEAAYEEARRCMSATAYVAAETVCRKILMHVAVDKDAKEGLKFAAYLAHLEAAGYITPPMKPWVGLIRDHG